jgi:hypothetical protein
LLETSIVDEHSMYMMTAAACEEGPMAFSIIPALEKKLFRAGADSA